MKNKRKNGKNLKILIKNMKLTNLEEIMLNPIIFFFMHTNMGIKMPQPTYIFFTVNN